MSIEPSHSAMLLKSESRALLNSTTTALVGRGLSELRQSESAQQLWVTGRGLVAEDRFDEALKCFNNATRLRPQDAEWQWSFTFAMDALNTNLSSRSENPAAVEWYRVGAERDIPWAQCRLGQAYCHGLGVQQDFKQAVEWFALAADEHSEAQCMLGRLWHCGYGVLKDITTAIYWYREAATNKGDRTWSDEARMYLGDIYDQGDCVPANSIEASFWYLQVINANQSLAEQGWGQSQYRLGTMYECVNKDLKEAESWYEKAADKGCQNAIDALKKIRRA